jgi:hypothetical protein
LAQVLGLNGAMDIRDNGIFFFGRAGVVEIFTYIQKFNLY